MAEVVNPKTFIAEIKKKMEKSLEAAKKEFKNLRTGRASVALVEGVQVDYYNTPTPLKSIASISTPDPKTIAIQPWEASIVPEVEKAILKSDLGLTPSNDGHVIRISIPPLTEERRSELSRIVRKAAEEGRVSVRSARHEGIEQIKKLEKDNELTEDDVRMLQKEIQKITDDFVKQVDQALENKEKEIHAI